MRHFAFVALLLSAIGICAYPFIHEDTADADQNPYNKLQQARCVTVTGRSSAGNLPISSAQARGNIPSVGDSVYSATSFSTDAGTVWEHSIGDTTQAFGRTVVQSDGGVSVVQRSAAGDRSGNLIHICTTR